MASQPDSGATAPPSDVATAENQDNETAPPTNLVPVVPLQETAADTDKPAKLNIGTRKSALAIAQTEIVRNALAATWPGKYDYSIVDRDTVGDKNQSRALHSFGAKALWTQELEVLLMAGACDLVVHSLKDMPTQLPPDCQLGAIMPREDPRDALTLPASVPPPSSPQTATQILSAMPAGSLIGTSSVRRSAQLSRHHPHLRFASVRGAMGTRLSKVDHPANGFSAIIVPAAGLKRIGLGGRISAYLSTRKEGGAPGGSEEKKHLYAVGQGALGVEVRNGDTRVLGLLESVGCERTTRQCLAERSLMRTLEGGCSVPIGVETEWVREGAAQKEVDVDDFWTVRGNETDELVMRAVVVSLDGQQAVEVEVSDTVASRDDADEFGRKVAAAMVEKGAGHILQKINLNRDIIEGQGNA